MEVKSILVVALLAFAPDVASLRLPIEGDQKALIPPNFCNSIKSYTAIGDSFSSGIGALEILDQECGSGQNPAKYNCSTRIHCAQDKGAYGFRFAQEFGIENFQYLACGGATVHKVMDEQVNGGDGKDFGRDDLTPGLVTLTVGGNDGSNFRDAMIKCYFARADRDAHRECMKTLKDAEDTLTLLPTRLKELTDAISRRVRSSTRIVVLSYAQFFNTDKGDCGILDRILPEEKQAMNKITRTLNSHVERAARQAGFTWASVDADYAGHRFCDNLDPEDESVWFQLEIHSIFNPSPFHPTFNGQTAYLAKIKEVLHCT